MVISTLFSLSTAQIYNIFSVLPNFWGIKSKCTHNNRKGNGISNDYLRPKKVTPGFARRKVGVCPEESPGLLGGGSEVDCPIVVDVKMFA